MKSAQEAYKNSILNLKDLDTTDLLIRASNQIEDASNQGYFATSIRQIEDIKASEKLAIQLEQVGYNCLVVNDSPKMVEGSNGFINTSGVIINWKTLPANTREDYSIEL